MWFCPCIVSRFLYKDNVLCKCDYFDETSLRESKALHLEATKYYYP